MGTTLAYGGQAKRKTTMHSIPTSGHHTSRRSPGTPRRPRTPCKNTAAIVWKILTFGYMTYDVTSESVMCLPNLLRSSALTFLNSMGASPAPGLPSILGLLRIILLRRGSGNPPTGCPRYPWKNSTTEDGKSSWSARSMTSCFENPFWTIHCAKSPTTFDDGVTYIMVRFEHPALTLVERVSP